MRLEIQIIKTKDKRKKYYRNNELNEKTSFLIIISFALNIIQIKLSDSAHFEYKNVIKRLHELLFNVILIN